MEKKNLMVMMGIVVFLIGMVGRANADTEITSIPFTASVSGERYYLTQDLTCSAGSHGIIIGANSITIDGDGYAIIGSSTDCSACNDEDSPTDCACGVVDIAGYNNASIKNLEVTGFCHGIVIQGPAENDTIKSCAVHDNGGNGNGKTYGIYLVKQTTHCIINQNDIYRNTGSSHRQGSAGGHGIRLLNDSDYNRITCNNIHSNEGAGICSKKHCKYNYIAYNNVIKNGISITQGEGLKFQGGGIRLKCVRTDYWTIEYNYIAENIGPGIFVRASYDTIRCNTIIGNKNGALMDPCDKGTTRGVGIVCNPDGSNAHIVGNTLCNNQEEDVYICSGHPVTYDSNCCENVVDLSGSNFTCSYNCNNLVSVYYDYDGDGYYSVDTLNCSCFNILDVGSCCNPGKFPSAEVSKHCACYNCKLSGDDLNDCCDTLHPTGIEETSSSLKVYGLSQSYPNPARRTVTICYQLPEATKVFLRIYDITGKLVTTIVDATQEPGYYNKVWNGRNCSGKEVPSGLYFLKLETSNYTAIQKLTILK